MKPLWEDSAWEDYCFWQSQDRKTLRKINALIRDICREPFHGIGKPEPLKENLSGWWSRHIDECNRIVYRAKEDTIEIMSCRDHYE